jgi:hypothetical protein
MSDIQVLADRVEKLVAQYGPDVAATILGAARIDAVAALIAGLMCLCIVTALLVAGWRLRAVFTDDYKGALNEDAMFIAYIVGGIVALILTLVTFLILFDPWVYVTLFEPKYWIAKKTLGL